MLRRELHRLNEIKKASTADKCIQTIEDQILVSTNKKKLLSKFLLITIIVKIFILFQHFPMFF